MKPAVCTKFVLFRLQSIFNPLNKVCQEPFLLDENFQKLVIYQDNNRWSLVTYHWLNIAAKKAPERQGKQRVASSSLPQFFTAVYWYYLSSVANTYMDTRHLYLNLLGFGMRKTYTSYLAPISATGLKGRRTMWAFQRLIRWRCRHYEKWLAGVRELLTTVVHGDKLQATFYSVSVGWPLSGNKQLFMRHWIKMIVNRYTRYHRLCC